MGIIAPNAPTGPPLVINQSVPPSNVQVSVPSSGSGAWVEYIASTDQDCDFILAEHIFTLPNKRSSGFDIGVGPSGSETVIVENLIVAAGEEEENQSWCIPIHVPKNTRISVRGVHNFGGSCTAYILLCLHNTGRSAAPGSDAVGTKLIYLGSANTDAGPVASTYGDWTELSASVPGNIKRLYMSPDIAARTSQSAAVYYWGDLAVGAEGEERSIIEAIHWRGEETEVYHNYIADAPISIAKGERLSARSMCTGTAISYRSSYINAWGLI